MNLRILYNSSNNLEIRLLRAIPLQFLMLVKWSLDPFGIGTIVETENEVCCKTMKITYM